MALCSHRKHDLTSRIVNMTAVLRHISHVAFCDLLADASLKLEDAHELYRQVKQPPWLLECEARVRIIAVYPQLTRVPDQNKTNKGMANVPSAAIWKKQYGCVACSAA